MLLTHLHFGRLENATGHKTTKLTKPTEPVIPLEHPLASPRHCNNFISDSEDTQGQDLIPNLATLQQHDDMQVPRFDPMVLEANCGSKTCTEKLNCDTAVLLLSLNRPQTNFQLEESQIIHDAIMMQQAAWSSVCRLPTPGHVPAPPVEYAQVNVTMDRGGFQDGNCNTPVCSEGQQGSILPEADASHGCTEDTTRQKKLQPGVGNNVTTLPGGSRVTPIIDCSTEHEEAILEVVRFDDAPPLVLLTSAHDNYVTVTRGSSQTLPFHFPPEASTPVKNIVADFANSICRTRSPVALAQQPLWCKAHTPSQPPTR